MHDMSHQIQPPTMYFSHISLLSYSKDIFLEGGR